MDLSRLRTQPRNDFVFHPFVFVKLLASQMFLELQNKWKSLGARSVL
jgi:hypothetical protein